jgi:purine-nucleoside phosphorylase
MTFSTIAVLAACDSVMAERFRSNVQRNAQILAEELRQASSLALALCLDVFSDADRLRNDDAIGLKTIDMEVDRLANFVLDRRNRATGSNAARQVRHISRIVAVGFLK